MIRKATIAQDTAHLLSTLYACPITRIEAERKTSPMAQLVRHTKQAPAFI